MDGKIFKERDELLLHIARDHPSSDAHAFAAYGISLDVARKHAYSRILALEHNKREKKSRRKTLDKEIYAKAADLVRKEKA